MNSDLAVLLQTLRETTAGMTEQQLDWHPEGKWSTAQILEHLNLSYAGTTRGLGMRLAEGKPKAKSLTLKNLIQQAVVLNLGYIPTGRKAPEMTTPKDCVDCKEIVNKTLTNLSEMAAKIDEAQAKFGSSVRVLDHPVLGPFKVAQWPRFHRVHGLHHAKQIERLKQMMPKS